jgi:hypothetical protein
MNGFTPKLNLTSIKIPPCSLSHGLTLRPFPYPYQAMLAICSDLDETPNRHAYFEIMRFLNTREETSIGRGVGLEVGNTIYFDMPADQFAYWNTDDTGRAMVRDLIRSGHIDCLHSYGDFATTRKHAGRALDELTRHDCRLEAWVDHGTAPTNFDGGIMKGRGDVQDSPVYHADLTMGFGIKYVWCGRVTSVIGQNIERNLSGIWSTSHPLDSGKTIMKEFSKGLLGHFNNKKYAMHAANRIIRRSKLRDNQEVYEFMRCNPCWGGVSVNDTATGITDVLTKTMLQKLAARRGSCILYTHLGKNGGNVKIFNNATQKAFALLSQFMREGKILVSTTRRLLGYCNAKEKISVSAAHISDNYNIKLLYMGNIDDLAGLTIYIPIMKNIRVWINDNESRAFQHNPPDQTGQCSISLPWKKLEFPQITY